MGNLAHFMAFLITEETGEGFCFWKEGKEMGALESLVDRKEIHNKVWICQRMKQAYCGLRGTFLKLRTWEGERGIDKMWKNGK